MCVGRCRRNVRCSCSGGVPRGSSSSFPSPNESPPSALRGSGLEKPAPGREGGTESAEVGANGCTRDGCVCLQSAFVKSEPKERQGRDCKRSVCHRLEEKLLASVGDLLRE